MDVTYRPFEDMEDFLVLSREIRSDDLIIAVSARKGTLSYHSYMDTLPAKLTKHFSENNFILLYPEQKQAEYLESGMQSQDLTLTPIQEQIDNFNKLGKAVKKINTRKELGSYTSRISVQSLAPGLYFLNVKTKNGRSLTTKFVKD